MRRPSLVHIVLAAHATCAGADLILACVWSSGVLALVGAGWGLVAALLFASRRAGESGSDVIGPIEARSDEPVALPDS